MQLGMWVPRRHRGLLGKTDARMIFMPICQRWAASGMGARRLWEDFELELIPMICGVFSTARNAAWPWSDSADQLPTYFRRARVRVIYIMVIKIWKTILTHSSYVRRVTQHTNTHELARKHDHIRWHEHTRNRHLTNLRFRYPCSQMWIVSGYILYGWEPSVELDCRASGLPVFRIWSQGFIRHLTGQGGKPLRQIPWKWLMGLLVWGTHMHTKISSRVVVTHSHQYSIDSIQIQTHLRRMQN